MDERRTRPRAPLETWVEIAIGRGRRRASASDVSVGGLGIALDGADLQPEARVVSEFPLPGIGLPVEIAAEVAWCDSECGRLGLRFVEVDPGLAELLGSFVSGKLAD